MSETKPNKQLFANSGLKELFAAETASGDGVSNFFNAREPNLAIMHEKPEHRAMLYMKAQGASNREIAEATGYTQPWLSQLFRQPWAQSRLAEIMNDCGKDRVTTLLASAAEDSVLTLIELRDDPEAPKAVRKSSADSLLDRYLGKPTQQVELRSLKADDVSDLDERLAELEREESRLMGRTALTERIEEEAAVLKE